MAQAGINQGSGKIKEAAKATEEKIGRQQNLRERKSADNKICGRENLWTTKSAGGNQKAQPLIWMPYQQLQDYKKLGQTNQDNKTKNKCFGSDVS